MNKLNIPQSGGYPIVNENLRVLADYADVFKKIISALLVPTKTVVFLENTDSLAPQNGNFLVYVKDANGVDNIVSLNTGAYSLAQLFSSTNYYQVNVSIQQINTVVGGVTYNNVRTVETATITPATSGNGYNFMPLKRVLMNNYTINTIASDLDGLFHSQTTQLQSVKAYYGSLVFDNGGNPIPLNAFSFFSFDKAITGSVTLSRFLNSYSIFISFNMDIRTELNQSVYDVNYLVFEVPSSWSFPFSWFPLHFIKQNSPAGNSNAPYYIDAPVLALKGFFHNRCFWLQHEGGATSFNTHSSFFNGNFIAETNFIYQQ